MRKFFTNLLLTILLISVPLTSLAQNVTVNVDCTVGESINEALRTVATELTININGTCTEDVRILRSRVNLVGTNPETDGIAPNSDAIDRALVIFGANTITLNNLRLVEGRFGLSINSSFGIRANNVHIEVDNGGYGVIAGSASGSINFTNMSVISGGVGTRGLWATNGSSLSCYGCIIDNFRMGVRANSGSEVNLYGTKVYAEEYGAYVAGGSRLFADSWCSGDGCIRVWPELDGGPGLSLSLQGTASALLRETRLTGVLNVTEKSVLTLRQDVAQIATSGANLVSRGSSLIIDGQASLQMDYNVSEFSNLTLPSSSSIRGALNCHTGGDAYCGDQTNILFGSNCNFCLHAGSQCIADNDCGENNACTHFRCVQGVCEEENADCGYDDPNDCRVTFCDPFLGCISDDAEQYSPCDDGDACGSQDYCLSGVCQDGCEVESICEVGWCGADGECQSEPVDCGDLPNDCRVDQCDPFLGCISNELPDGTACDDNNPDTTNDQCVAGTCAGEA